MNHVQGYLEEIEPGSGLVRGKENSYVHGLKLQYTRNQVQSYELKENELYNRKDLGSRLVLGVN